MELNCNKPRREIFLTVTLDGMISEQSEVRSSKKERRVDALALRADERRDKLR